MIGVGIEGDGNIIWKNVNLVINEYSSDCGLTLIAPNHFKENTDVDEDVRNWRNGFPFALESIYQEKEYRRQKVISEIRNKLETTKRLLILGFSGTSKTTLLMEILCSYFNDNYTILVNLGRADIKNRDIIITKIKGLADAGNQVLIIIDDVQSTKTKLIFDIIDSMNTLNKNIRDKISFLLAARQPEFNWILEKNLFDDTDTVQMIEEQFDENHRYLIPNFNLEEIKEFLVKYEDCLNTSVTASKTIEQYAQEIFEDTKGYPIMVKFSVLNQGLETHVKKMYREYILAKTEINQPRLKVVILNSLFDISTIELKDEMLNECGLLKNALDMQDTIIKQSGDVWRTIHSKWDMELFRFMFSLEYSLDDIQSSFKDTISKIIKYTKIDSFNLLFILNTIYYTFTKEKVISPDIIENNLNLSDIEKKFDDYLKLLWYSHVIGLFYKETNRNDLAIEFFDKAQAIDSQYGVAYYNKGWSLSKLGRYEDAIVEYDKALKIDENGSVNLSVNHILLC